MANINELAKRWDKTKQSFLNDKTPKKTIEKKPEVATKPIAQIAKETLTPVKQYDFTKTPSENIKPTETVPKLKQPTPVQAKPVSSGTLRMPTIGEKVRSFMAPYEAFANKFNEAIGINRVLDYFTPEKQKAGEEVYAKSLEERYPKQGNVGSIAGNIATYTGGAKLATTLAKGLNLGTKLTSATQYVVPNVVMGGLEGIGKKESPAEIAKRIGMYTALDVGASKVFSALGKVAEPIIAPKILQRTQPQTQPMVLSKGFAEQPNLGLQFKPKEIPQPKLTPQSPELYAMAQKDIGSINLPTAKEIPLKSNVEPKMISQRKLPDISQMTKQEFDTYYKLDKAPTMESVENLIQDTGARIMNRTGLSDIPKIVDYYKNKYNLPKNINVGFSLQKGTTKGATTPKFNANGDVIGYRININPNQSLEGRIGSLRHEVEHIIDLQRGFKEATNKYKFNPKLDKTARQLYEKAAKGHHEKYGWFEPDYLRRATVKDAIKTGREVPESVLKEFPELKGIKSEKPIIPTQQVDNVVEMAEPTLSFKQPITETPKEIPTQQVAKETPMVQPTKQPSKLEAYGETGKELERGASKTTRVNIDNPQELRQTFDETPLKYKQQSERAVEERARNIMAKGYEEAKSEFYSTINNLDRTENPVLATLLAREATKRGNIEEAKQIIADIAERLTFAGRFSNANKILLNKDPATIEKTLEKLLKRLNDEGTKLRGTKWKEVKMSDNFKKDIYKLEIYDEKALNELMLKAEKEFNDQIPSEFREKLTAWRRMAMLFNPTTHIRNITGNALMSVMRKGKDIIAQGLEKTFIKDGVKTKSLGWSRDKELLNTVNKHWDDVSEELTKTGKWDVLSTVGMNQTERDIFKTKAIEKISKFSRDILTKEDNFFFKRAYKDTLGQYMKSNGLKEVTEEAMDYATKEADKAVFRQVDDLTKFIEKSKRGKYGLIVESQLPFVKTPVNILKRSLEYSPLGFADLLFAKKQGKTASDVIDTISAGMTGSAVLGLGFLLADMGWARGKKTSSAKLEGLQQEAGNQPFSIDTPFGNYTVDWAQPASSAFIVGTTLYEVLKKKDDGAIGRIISALASGGDTVLEQSFLKNVMQVIKGSPTEELMNFPLDLVEQSVPALLGKSARAVDTTRRSTYAQSELEGFKKRVVSRVPFASKKLEPQLNVWGQEQTQGMVSQFISPGYGKVKSNDSVTIELLKLYNSAKTKEDRTLVTGALPNVVDTRSKEYTPEQVTKLQRIQGQENYKAIKNKIMTSEYRDADFKEKVSMINSITDKNWKDAKIKVLGEKPIKETKRPRKKGWK